MFEIITTQILKMLLLLLVGCLCYRIKIVDQAGSKMLANLLLLIVNPCVALTSLQTDYSPKLVHGLLIAYILAFFAHLLMAVLSRLMIRRKGNDEAAIEQFSAMYANCGFIGIPLVQSTLGSEGVLYLTAFMTMFNVFSWTHGVTLMTGKTSIRDIRKGLLSPMIVASFIGLILFVCRIRFPQLLSGSLKYIADMNTPLAMLIAGISIAQTNIPAMLKNRKLYFVSFFKLLVMPAIILLMLIPLKLDATVAMTTLIAAACPVAATCTAFALRFHKNYKYASELYAFSTICSMITIPVFVLAAERLLI